MYCNGRWVDDAIIRARVKLLRSLREHLPELHERIASDERSHYVAYSQDVDGMVSYAKRPADVFYTERRVRTSFARYLSRRLNIDVNGFQKQCEAISAVNGFNGEAFVIRSDVAEVYDMLRRKGIDRNGCMRENPNGCLSFYEENGVPVLVFKEVARALLWTKEDGSKFLDRIYPNEGAHTPHYREYCETHGIEMRSHQYLPEPNSPDTDGSITVDASGAIPYMDTFRYATVLGETHETELRAHRTEGEPKILLNDIYGGTIQSSMAEMVTCDICDSEFDSDDPDRGTVDNEAACPDCYSDSSYCDRCHINRSGDFATIDGYYTCDSCTEEAYACEVCDTFSFRGMTDVEMQDGRTVTHCSDCLQENATRCDNCDEWFTEDAQEVGGYEVCSVCFDDAHDCERCGEKTFSSLRDVEGEACCANCYFSAGRCASCGKVSFDDLTANEFGRKHCSGQFCTAIDASINEGNMASV